jgi:TP901 family phage tail tape measure protein
VARTSTSITIPISYLTKKAGLDEASSLFGKFANGIATGAALAVTAVAGIGTAAVRMANEFDQSFAKIQGLVGLSTSEIAQLEEAAARLGPQFGKSAQEAADALFFITSSGLRGADAVDVLEASLQAAAAGLGDTQAIANVATASVNTYGSSVLSGKEAVDALTEAVRLGQFAPEELASSLGRVIPISAELGVQFQEVTGFVAALTRGGVSASEAVTGIRGVMSAVIRPTEQAKEALANVGLTAEGLKASVEQDGLLNTLIMLRDAFGENEEGLTRVFGDLEGLNAVLSLTGENVATNVDIIKQMTDGVGVLDDAFGVVEETAGFKFTRAMEQAKASLLPVGDTLLDLGAKLLDSLGPTLEMLGPMFEQMFAHLEEPLAELAGILPALFQSFMPLLPILGQIAGVIAELAVALMPVFIAFMNLLVPILEMIMPPLTTFVTTLVEALAPILTTLIEALTPIITGLLPVLITLFQLLIDPILYFIEVFSPIIDALLPVFTQTLELIVIPLLQMLAEWLGTILPAAFQMLIDSGFLPSVDSAKKWGEAFTKIVAGVRTFIAEGMNYVIEALEKAANAAINMVNRLIAAGKALPGAAGALFKGIKPIANLTFERVAVPGAYDYLTFPDVDVAGIRDVNSRFMSSNQSLGGRFATNTSTLSGVLSASQQRGFYTDTFGNTVWGNIPQMAKGGIVTAPTIAMVGEAGSEAIIPLDRLDGMGGPTYNITINAGVGSDPVRVGEYVVSAIKRYERASGKVFASA